MKNINKCAIALLAMLASLKSTNAMDTGFHQVIQSAQGTVYCVTTQMPLPESSDRTQMLTLGEKVLGIFQAQGLIGAQFSVNPTNGTTSTYSIWINQEAAMNFVRSELHQIFVNMFRSEDKSNFKVRTSDVSWENAPKNLQSAVDTFLSQ